MSERADYSGSGGARSPAFDYELVDRYLATGDTVVTF